MFLRSFLMGRNTLGDPGPVVRAYAEGMGSNTPKYGNQAEFHFYDPKTPNIE